MTSIEEIKRKYLRFQEISDSEIGALLLHITKLEDNAVIDTANIESLILKGTELETRIEELKFELELEADKLALGLTDAALEVL